MTDKTPEEIALEIRNDEMFQRYVPDETVDCLSVQIRIQNMIEKAIQAERSARLKAEAGHLTATEARDLWGKRIKELEALVRKLAEALKPFAYLYTDTTHKHNNEPEHAFFKIFMHTIDEARQALAEVPPELREKE